MALTWTFEQGTANAGTSQNVAFGANCKAGSLLIAVTTGANTDNPAAPTDTIGNTYNLGAYIPDATNGCMVKWWYAFNPTAAANTVTFVNLANFDSYSIAEFTVDAGTISLDVKDDGNLRNHTNATDNIVSDTVSTSVSDVLLVGINMEDGADVTISAGTNYTMRVSTFLEGFSGNPVNIESRVLASAGSATATFTTNVSGRGAASIGCFKSSAAGGGGGGAVSTPIASGRARMMRYVAVR